MRMKKECSRSEGVEGLEAKNIMSLGRAWEVDSRVTVSGKILIPKLIRQERDGKEVTLAMHLPG